MLSPARFFSFLPLLTHGVRWSEVPARGDRLDPHPYRLGAIPRARVVPALASCRLSRLSFSIRELAHELNVPLRPTQTYGAKFVETHVAIFHHSPLLPTPCVEIASGRHGASFTRIPVPRGPRNSRRGSHAGGSGGACPLVRTLCVGKLLHPTNNYS